MITDFALALLWDIPIIAYSGVIFFLLTLFTAFVGYQINKGKCKFSNPIIWHKTIAGTAVLFGFISIILGLAIIIGF